MSNVDESNRATWEKAQAESEMRRRSFGDPPSTPGGGGSTFDPMEARVAKLEAHVEHIQTDLTDIKADLRQMRDGARSDFRMTWGGMIVGFLGVAGLMARGFGWL